MASAESEDIGDKCIGIKEQKGDGADSAEKAAPGRNRARHEKSVFEIMLDDANKYKKQLIIAVAVIFLVLMFLFSSIIKEFFLLVVFIALGAASRMWQKFIPFSIGAELVMLFTVVAGILFGPFAGLIVGFLSLSISTLVTEEDVSKMWPGFFAIAVVGYLAGTIEITNISTTGLMLTVLYDVMISIIYIATGHSLIKTLIFDATHIAFNYFVFYNLAPFLITLLA